MMILLILICASLLLWVILGLFILCRDKLSTDLRRGLTTGVKIAYGKGNRFHNVYGETRRAISGTMNNLDN